MKTGRLRKIIAGILIIVLAIMMTAACGSPAEKPQKETGNTADENKSEEESAETGDAGEDKFGLNETAVFDKLKMTALEMKESEGEEYMKPDDGKVYVGVKFRIENISDEDQEISSILLFNAYVDGTKTEAEWFPPSELSDGSLDGTLAAGKNMEGYYVVQAQVDWSEIQLDIQSEWLSSTKAEFVINK